MKEYEEHIKILANEVLLKLPPHRAIAIHTFMSSLDINHIRDKYSQEIINSIDQAKAVGNSYVRDFLLDYDYLETINHSIPSDKLTPRGMKAKELGGHENYLKCEEQERKKKLKEESKIFWPKKNWLLVGLLFALAGAVFGGIITYILTPKLTVQIVHDTLQIVRRDTIYKENPHP